MLGNATDMVMDNNDNIYILDANKRKIIKLDAVTNTPETYHDINADFDWQYESDESSPYNNRHFKNTEFIPMKLAYSSDSNKLYVAGVFGKINAFPNERTGLFALYDITGVVDVVSFGEVVYPYTDSIKHQIRNITFINSSQFYLITNTVMFEGGVGQAIKSLGDYGLFLFDNYSTGVVANETDVHIIIPVNLRKRWQIDR